MLQSMMNWWDKSYVNCPDCSNVSSLNDYCSKCNNTGKIYNSRGKPWIIFLLFVVLCFFIIRHLFAGDNWHFNLFWSGIGVGIILTIILGRFMTAPIQAKTEYEYNGNSFIKAVSLMFSAVFFSFIGSIIAITKVDPESMLITPGVQFGFTCGLTYLCLIALVSLLRDTFNHST